METTEPPSASNTTIRTVDCAPQCANGGSCVQGTCICPPGYIGAACENLNIQTTGNLSHIRLMSVVI